MIWVALRMLTGDRLKFLALVAGLAFAATMIAQQASIFSGYAARAGAWVRDTANADLWVMDPQTEVTIAQKRLTETALQRIRGVDGVSWAVPLFVGPLTSRLPDGTLQPVRVIGIDDATLTGGPPEMVAGRLEDLRRDRGVIVNQADLTKLLRFRTDPSRGVLGVGDRLEINDREVEIVGIYRKSREFFWEPVIYTTYTRATFIAPPERRLTQYVLVGIRPGEDRGEVQRRIESATGLAARTPAEFATMTTWYVLIQTGILINFGITIALGIVIGLLVTSLLLYTFTLENVRTFAAIKALGLSNPRLAGMVCVQVGYVVLLGYGLGVGMAALAGQFIEPEGSLAFRMVWQIPAFVAGALAVCGLAAGLLSLARVFKLEPAVVFKG